MRNLILLCLMIFSHFCKPDLKSKLNFIYSLSQTSNTNLANPNPTTPISGSTLPTINYPNTNYNLRLSKTISSITPSTTGANLQFSISPAIPVGLSFDTTTGIITGAATALQTSTSYTVQVTNTAGSASASFTILIVGQEPKKTGLTQCWDSAGGVISCPGTGQDGDLQAGTTANFSAPAGTTTYPTQFLTKDNLTGLIWKTCRQGFTGATCGGGGSTLGDFSTVTTICGSLNPINSGAGFGEINTWRVPTVTELENLINHSVSGPASYSTAFPGELNTPILWTSTPDPNDILKGFVISFGNTGNTTNLTKTTNRGVRCVNGTSATPSFTDRNDGTILDMNTGLLWKKCPQGLSGATCSTGSANNVDWFIALGSCNTLNLGGLTWRLPNINELKTIIDRSVSNPSIDSTIFPNTAGTVFWTSTTTNFTGNTGNAYWISFFIGDNIGSLKTNTAQVRCVSSLTPIQ